MTPEKTPGSAPGETRYLVGRGAVAVLLIAGTVLAASLIFGMSSAQSPNNCGELPGLTRWLTMLAAAALAAITAIVGLVVAAIKRSWGLLGAFGLIALAAPLGVFIGQGMVATEPCDYGPQPVQVPATIEVTFTVPYAGALASGPAECLANDAGEPFYEIVSDVGRPSFLTQWRFGNPNDKFAEAEIWPGLPRSYGPTQHLRITITRLSDEGLRVASADYTDSGEATIQLDSNVDGSSGTVVFTDLPAGNTSGSGLPASITGHLSWSCPANVPTP